MTDKIVVLSTCSGEEEAVRIARALVEKRVAACVNIVPRIRSIYHWQGTIEDSAEALLVIKTRRAVFEQLRDELRAVHSYELPEVVALSLVDGAADYLEWIDREVAPLA
jgi:periplasmic divalent cation tolerance protein